MDPKNVISALDALAQEARLHVFKLLVYHNPDGLVAGRISETLGIPPANLSFHLKTLLHAGLISVEQEGRFQRYRANLSHMVKVIGYLTENCCANNPGACEELRPANTSPAFLLPPDAGTRPNGARTFSVLFLCTGNSARSILSEALLNHLGEGRFRAYSAGSHPTGRVNPFAIELLEEKGIPTKNLRSKSWDEFASDRSPRFDFIFTVCDNAAGETCPHWPGSPITAHWGVPDPAFASGDEKEKRAAFESTYLRLKERIESLLRLPLEALDPEDLKRSLADIGRLEKDHEQKG